MSFGGVGIDGDGAANQSGGAIMAAYLVGDQAQQMQDIGLLGLLDKNLAVELFGLAQAAGLVMLQG
jgi:hypothetical protein